VDMEKTPMLETGVGILPASVSLIYVVVVFGYRNDVFFNSSLCLCQYYVYHTGLEFLRISLELLTFNSHRKYTLEIHWLNQGGFPMSKGALQRELMIFVFYTVYLTGSTSD